MSAPASPPSFWQRRVRGPLVALFTQGVTPDKIALSFAVGSACSLLPFLGLTSLLNLGAGLWLRLNQPLLQTLNQVLGPLQLLLILVYVRLGEWLLRAPHQAVSIDAGLALMAQGAGPAFAVLGDAIVHAGIAWLLVAPLAIPVFYKSLVPVFARAAAQLKGQS